MTETTVSIVKLQPKPDYEKILEAVQEALTLIGGIEDVVKPAHLVAN
jgi:hypothetical protein